MAADARPMALAATPASPAQRALPAAPAATRCTLTACGDTSMRSDCPSALRMQGHPFDFRQRGGAALDQFQRGLAQAARAVLIGRLLDLADRRLSTISSRISSFSVRISAIERRPL
jgi:hypothetical protein